MSPLPTHTPKALPMGLFCLLLLLPLVALLLACGGMFIHYAREIVTDSSQAYGRYTASQELADRGADIRSQLWFLTSSPAWRKNTQAWEECRHQLEFLAAASTQAEPHARALLAKMTLLANIRAHQRDLDTALHKDGMAPRRMAALLRQRHRLDNEADELLRSLPELALQLEQATSAANEMSVQLRANSISAQNQENHMLLFLMAALGYLAFVVWLVRKQVIRPLLGIRSSVGQLGTGVTLTPPPHSRVLVIEDIADGLENLATYLGQATVRSEEMETERIRFRRMSLIDGLTNLYNRRAFDDTLRKLWDEARHNGKPLGVIMMDIDKFKVYNDSLGHQAGDVCLRTVAGAVARAVRANDVAARYGGEEFVVLLPNTDNDQALAAAERIRVAVESTKLPHPGSPAGPYVTISLGVCAEVPMEGGNPADLVRHADKALYFSKENGRNRATTFSPTMA